MHVFHGASAWVVHAAEGGIPFKGDGCGACHAGLARYAALLLNATKHLANIDLEIKFFPQSMIEPIQKTKTEYLGGFNPRLRTDDVLVAISVLSQNDDNYSLALQQLPKLRGCQVHSAVMLSEVDRKIFKKLGCHLTCEPVKKKKSQGERLN